MGALNERKYFSVLLVFAVGVASGGQYI